MKLVRGLCDATFSKVRCQGNARCDANLTPIKPQKSKGLKSH